MDANSGLPQLLVTAAEAAAMLSMGKSTFWQNVKNGKLPQPVKIGGATRWRVADLHQWVSQLQHGGPTT